MDDLDISPLVGQVFGDEAAVAVIRRLFAAKEAAVGHKCSREVLFDFAFRDEFQKSPPVRIPVATFAVCFEECLLEDVSGPFDHDCLVGEQTFLRYLLIVQGRQGAGSVGGVG